MYSLPLNLHMQGMAVQLANLHKLQLPRSFLEYCAQNDDWVSFILFCQIYSYPPDIVSDKSLSYYLILFLFSFLTLWNIFRWKMLPSTLDQQH